MSKIINTLSFDINLNQKIFLPELKENRERLNIDTYMNRLIPNKGQNEFDNENENVKNLKEINKKNFKKQSIKFPIFYTSVQMPINDNINELMQNTKPSSIKQRNSKFLEKQPYKEKEKKIHKIKKV